jgi:hypothetical protein
VQPPGWAAPFLFVGTGFRPRLIAMRRRVRNPIHDEGHEVLWAILLMLVVGAVSAGVGLLIQ